MVATSRISSANLDNFPSTSEMQCHIRIGGERAREGGGEGAKIGREREKERERRRSGYGGIRKCGPAPICVDLWRCARVRPRVAPPPPRPSPPALCFAPSGARNGALTRLLSLLSGDRFLNREAAFGVERLFYHFELGTTLQIAECSATL